MSLLFYGRRIERAVAGELGPEAEENVRRHVGGCEPCGRYYERLSRTSRVLSGTTSATRTERSRTLARLQAALASGRPTRRASRGAVPWACGIAGVAVAVGAFLLIVRTPERREPKLLAQALSPLPDLAEGPPTQMPLPRPPTSSGRSPYEGDPPGMIRTGVVGRFDFEEVTGAHHPQWIEGTVQRCPGVGSRGNHCMAGRRALPCCPWLISMTWGDWVPGHSVVPYTDDLVVSFRYWTGEGTSRESLIAGLQIIDTKGTYYYFNFPAGPSGRWHRVTIPLSWMWTNPENVLGLGRQPFPGRTSLPIGEGTVIKDLNFHLLYSREDVLLVDDVELARFSPR